jgi:ATP-dependent Clp protease, protease subunit
MSETVYLTFHDNITLQSANRIITTSTDILRQFNPKTLYFAFSSGGGSVDSGITVYNFLKGLPCRLITHNIGSIDLIANAIFLAGKDRYSTPNAAFLFHGITWNFGQGTSLTYSQMQETLSRFDAAEQLFAGVIDVETKFSIQEVRDLFRQGQSKGPDFALAKGVIHEIKEFEVLPGSEVFSVPCT